jgi:hypothetical protein
MNNKNITAAACIVGREMKSHRTLAQSLTESAYELATSWYVETTENSA